MKRLLGGFAKYLILVLAAIPLARGAWEGFEQLRQVNALDAAVQYNDQAQQAAEDSSQLPDVDFMQKAKLYEPVLTFARRTRITVAELTTEEERELAQELENHASVIDDTWRLFDGYHRLQNDQPLPDIQSPPFDPSHSYYGIWLRRYRVVESEAHLSELRKSHPTNIDEARALLADYQQLPDSDPEFAKRVSGEVEGYALRYMDDVDVVDLLKTYFKSASDEQTATTVRNSLERRLEKLTEYSLRYSEPQDYVQWSKRESNQFNLAKQIIEIGQSSRQKPLAQRVKLYSDVLIESGGTDAVIHLVRETVYAMCDAYLKPQLPLDEMLYVRRYKGEAVASPPIDRNDIVVVWNDRKMQWLHDTDFNEFTLPIDDVYRLIVRDSGTLPPLIAPTKLSEAAHSYNNGRKKLRWTRMSIDAFTKTCEPYREQLGTNWQKLNDISEIATAYKIFFPAQ